MVLNILTHHLVVKSLVLFKTLQIKVYSKFLNYKIYSEHENNAIHTTQVITTLKILYSRRKWIRHVFFESESYQMKILKLMTGWLIKHLVNMLEEQFILYCQLIPNDKKIADHITFLHIGNTVHWCTRNVNYMQNWILLNTWIAEILSAKFKQMIHVSLIKIFYFCALNLFKKFV